MKSDTQHLDYLISQYVDGCLDTSNRKSLEQRFVNDPASRRLYTEQREVQDLLDEWGSRIPMIDWSEFDQKLAVRLEKEGVGSRVSRMGRWWRPMAAAAALFVAAAVGYSWHAYSNEISGSRQGSQPVARLDPAHPGAPVRIEDMNKLASASSARVIIDDAPADLAAGSNRDQVAIFSPQDSAASRSLGDALNSGLSQGVAMSAVPEVAKRGSVSAMAPTSGRRDPDNKEQLPAFP